MDYLIVSRSIAPLIKHLRAIFNVPWSPHFAIEFIFRAEPEAIVIRAQWKPKEQPCCRNEKGRLQQWCISVAEWERHYDEAAEQADHHKEKMKNSNDEQSNHIKKLGIG